MIAFSPSAIRFSRWARVGPVIIASFALVGLTACGASSTPSAPSGGATVNVTLQEFAVVPDVASVNAGKVTFKATNNGPADVHELVVVKTDLGARALPASAEGQVDENGAGITVIGEIEDVEVGKSASTALDLTPGKYVLLCNIVQDEPDGTKESHYLKGMSIAFTVK